MTNAILDQLEPTRQHCLTEAETDLEELHAIKRLPIWHDVNVEEQTVSLHEIEEGWVVKQALEGGQWNASQAFKHDFTHTTTVVLPLLLQAGMSKELYKQLKILEAYVTRLAKHCQDASTLNDRHARKTITVPQWYREAVSGFYKAWRGGNCSVKRKVDQ